ncbi:MAG: Coenzyme F420 hydrogenase/dehydrogenase, beta subunit C-terminal domain [Chloroflexota bacterium]
MPKVLELSKGIEDSVLGLLKFLLESGKVSGVITLTKMSESNTVAYSLITSPDLLRNASPLFPLMPVNAGKMLSRITLMEPSEKPIAVVMRPCELRGFVELLKRTQGSSENFLFISLTCGGVYTLKAAVDGDIEKKLPEYWETVKKGEIVPDVRPNCAACTEFVPHTADMTVASFGNNDLEKRCEIYLNTEKAEAIVTEMEGKISEREPNTKSLEALRSKREGQTAKLLDEFKDMDVEKVFGSCIGCHACSNVCPACYCHLCFFDSPTSDHSARDYESKVEKEGSVRVPLDTIFYHLVRLFHVSLSCVGCGQCSDVCPVNIPLGIIAIKTSGPVQQAFDYVAGKSIEEGLPITTFKPEEFAGVAD